MAENSQAHFRCASYIAHLEGKNRLTLPDDIFAASTLAALDTRLRKVEDNSNITTPAACQPATWDSLAFRVYRLRTPHVVSNFNRVWTPTDFLELVENPSDVSDETLQKLCFDLGYNPPTNWVKTIHCADENDALGVFGQICCYYAGIHCVHLTSIPVTKADIYGMLVRFSMEKTPISGRIIPPRPGNNVPAGVTVINSAPRARRKKQTKRRFASYFNFSWLKTLACWRKKKSGYASSIYSSSSSNSSTSTL